MRDPELWHRVLRFLPSVGIPVIAALVLGVHPWIVYAVLGAVVSFLGDCGGRAGERLGYMAVGPVALVAGAAIGTVSIGVPVLFLGVAFLLGLYYGLVEGGHAHLLLLARFLGYGLVMGHVVAPIDWVDCAVAFAVTVQTWGISMLWDWGRSGIRPLSVAPAWAALRTAFRGWRARWTFALCAGVCVVSANVAGGWLGLGHPYWATLTVFIVLRSEVVSGAEMVTDRVLGTLLGVGAVAALLALEPSHAWLLVAMALAAVARWPAMSLDGGLGMAAATIFALLLGELIAPTWEARISVLHDRMLAIMVGCCFAMAASGLNRHLERLIGRTGQIA